MNLHDLIRLCIVTSYAELTEENIAHQLTQAGPVFGFHSATDVRIALEEVKSMAPLSNVYAHAVELCIPVIKSCTFARGEIVIGARGLFSLSSLLQWISLDLVVLLACAEQLDPLDQCPVWKLFPRFGSLHLRQMLSRGVGDMHMHEMAMRQPEDLWRRLVFKEVTWERVKRFELFAPWPSLVSPELFAEHLELCLERSRKHHERFSDPSDHRRFRDHERQFVYSIALKIKKKNGLRAERLYILTKNTLWRLVRQPETGTAPGLEAFAARWYPAVPKSGRDRRTRLDRPGHRAPRAFLFRELSVPLEIMAETPALVRVELRSTPMKNEVDYFKWVDVHASIFQPRYDWCISDPLIAEEPQAGRLNNKSLIAARLAVHFRRSTPKTVEDIHKSILRFDSEAAALLRFRYRFPDQSSCVGRIDMAVAERDMGCRILGFAYRTLRGPILDDIHTDVAKRFAPKISEIPPEIRATHLTLPRLGATCHAGEDFGCQLAGLREVADAIHSLGLSDGDSIGHGLALGWNPHTFFNLYGARSRLRVGEHFDSLLWAFTESGLGESGARWRSEIESRLFYLFHEIFDDYNGPFNADFWWQLRIAQLRFPLISKKKATSAVVKLVEREYTDPSVFKRRQNSVPEKYFSRYSQLLELIDWLRLKLIERISKRGIVIEVHPSSNIRVGGAIDPSEMPTIALLENEEILTSIGTDDPGVFATNVEYEYALMEEALIRKNNWPRHRAIELLDRVRRTSLEGIYWPNYSG